MLRDKLPESAFRCSCCRWRKPHGKPTGKCLTCSDAYTAEYKFKGNGRRIVLRERREKSDSKLATLYQRIKVKYFGDGYIPDSKFVLFTWKNRRGHFGAWCSKRRKEMRFGSIYRHAFIRKTISSSSMAVSSTFNEVRRKDLVELIIHEAVHLRMAHHKKNFKKKEAEIKGLVKDTDIEGLYEGLIQEGGEEHEASM